MKFISRGINGAYELAAYEDYLSRDPDQLSASVHGANLLSIDRFFPNGPGCFHDSRFEKFSLAIENPAEPDTEIGNLRLKGPYFDRFFELQYIKVNHCSFMNPKPEDDLLMHEIRRENGLVIHEILFDHGNNITVSCHELRFYEILISDMKNSS